MLDPRRVLEDAAEQRLALEVLPRNGTPRRGRIIRVERGGIVLTVPGVPVPAGSDVRVWITVNGQSYTFEASVLRAGVPVPDRSQEGLLLGFMDGFRKAERHGGTVLLDVIPHNVRPISLIDGAARVVDVEPTEWTITAPTDFNLIFAEGGTVRLRLGLPDGPPMEVGAKVQTLSRAEGHLLYRIRIEAVEDAARYGEIVDGIRRQLGL